MVLVLRQLERISADLVKVQERHVRAIQKAEEERQETRVRVEKLEAQVAFLMAEMAELKKQKGNSASERHSAGNVKILYEHGSPGRRTEPRKVTP